MDNDTTRKVQLRNFQDTDYALMEVWLARPHVAKWYKHPEHWLNELENRRTMFSFITHFIVELDGQPIGFCQYYDTHFAQEHEVWHDEWQVSEKLGEVYSIDYLIGEPQYLKQGIGKQIIKLLIERIWQLGAQEIIVEPEAENIASNKSLEANGFRWQNSAYVLKREKVL